MSYARFLDEMKLANKLMAITRVSKAYETKRPEQLYGCIYKQFQRVLDGETLLIPLGYCRCPGFAPNSGLLDSKPGMPGGIGRFLSKGSAQIGAPAGERFKACMELGEEMFDKFPKQVMDSYDAFKIEPYRDGMKCDVVTAFCNPDQLSAMIVLYGYDKSDLDLAYASTVSGCASMFRLPLAELKKEKPRAVITGTDLAQRHFRDENEIAISIIGPEFEKMIAVSDECFFNAPVWKPVKARLDGKKD